MSPFSCLTLFGYVSYLFCRSPLEIIRMGSIRIYYLMMTLTLLLLGSQPISGEVFSASADLTSTFRLEQQVVNVLGELVAQTEAKLGIIRQ